jgi:predicted TIM-barrel fold metal-dependent hydrolase
MASAKDSKPPVINCHTHIFTGRHVPPLLGKTILPGPSYYLANLRWIVGLFHWWYAKGPGRWPYMAWYKNAARILYRIRMFFARVFILSFIKFVAGIFVFIHVVYIIWDWLARFSPPGSSQLVTYLGKAREWLQTRGFLLDISNPALEILLVIALLLFWAWGRNLVFFILSRVWKFFGILPGKQTKELYKRYLSIGRFAFHEKQATIFSKLRGQYEKGTGFIVLPMDMEYMEAGQLRPSYRYRQQMKELAGIKGDHPDIIFPFVFVDPRRIIREPDFFAYSVKNEKVTWEDCFVRDLIENKKFSGFKIYPALGYYPFDTNLLPVWKYAADHGLPVLTHCIRGVIYYRGGKLKVWDEHPLFMQAMGRKNWDNEEDLQEDEEDWATEYRPMLLPERGNEQYSANFTHPLNYLCLLDEKLLRKLVGTADDKIKSLFGYSNDTTPLKHDLKNLKICFGHFGGDDEWELFFERDRDSFSSQLLKHPKKGIDFFRTTAGKEAPGKLEQVWKFSDWYTIICSLILQYPNVYGDISFILYKREIVPLLKHTLQNPQLREKVLFGTDFYVVRNHKSDKNMLASILADLSEEEFDKIARENPREFLRNNLE